MPNSGEQACNSSGIVETGMAIMGSSVDWSMVAAIATAVSALAVAVSVVFVFFQLRGLRLSQEVTVALTLYDRSTSPEILNAASWMKTQIPTHFTYQNYLNTPDTRKKLERLWYYFEFVGVLVNRGYVSEDLIFDQQGAFIAGIWDRTQELINARRLDRKSPQYMENFEILRDQFIEWAAVHRPKLAPHKMRKAQAYYEGEYRPSSAR